MLRIFSSFGAVVFSAIFVDHLANALWSLQLNQDGSFRPKHPPRRVSRHVTPRVAPRRAPMLRRQDSHSGRWTRRAQMQWRAERLKQRRVFKNENMNLTACQVGGKWPELDRFDLVISWWTNKNQSNIRRSRNGPASLLEQRTQSRFENQAEIRYALRSFEKFGLLKYVRNVHLLIGDDVLAKYGAPRFFNYSNKLIRIVTGTDIGVPKKCEGCGPIDQWSKLVVMHSIPGLSDYFLWLPDDNFLLHDFHLSSFWDAKAHRPILRSYGSWSLGYCAHGRAVGATHGPVLLQKCAMQAVLDAYFGSGTNGTKLIADHAAKHNPIDALCLFTRAMSPYWTDLGMEKTFHSECHTNGYSRNSCRTDATFINIQGTGVSDEYPPGIKRDGGLMSHGTENWFHEQYPKPSQFELQVA
mmetsp:Transcript_121766/g.191105  ORF Transcript_121766/g.191105 Transcript_121766/m.191105 type:complete len:412 (-) Transcript_121766:24-1259(-)